MKKRIGKFLVYLQILLIAFPMGIFYSPLALGASPIPTPSPSNFSDCSICDSVVYQDNVEKTCGSKPSDGSSKPILTSTNMMYPNYDSCAAQVAQQWTILKDYCSTRENYIQAEKASYATAIAFSAAAGVCFSAAAISNATLGAGATAAEAACTAADLGALAFDLATTIKLAINGAGIEQQLLTNSLSGLALIGPIGSAIAKSMFKSAIQKGITKTTNYIGKNVSQKLAQKLAESKLVKAISDRATKEASKRASAKAGTIGSLISATFLSAGATIKWLAYKSSKEGAGKECSRVADMNSTGSFLASVDHSPTPAGPKGNPAEAKLQSGGGGGSSGGGEPTSQTVSALTRGNDTQFPVGGLALATAGPLGKIFDILPNKNAIPRALSSLGTSLDKIGKELLTKPPGEALSAAMPSLPDYAKSDLKNMDKLGAEGKITMEGLPSSVATSSGGIKPSENSAPPWPMGGAAAVGTPENKEVDFGKKAAVLEPANDDIWHTSWNGTLFQLVTFRLSKTKDRIEQLEWDTPLNRALTGLKNTPIQTKPVQIQSRPVPGKHR